MAKTGLRDTYFFTIGRPKKPSRYLECRGKGTEREVEHRMPFTVNSVGQQKKGYEGKKGSDLSQSSSTFYAEYNTILPNM